MLFNLAPGWRSGSSQFSVSPPQHQHSQWFAEEVRPHEPALRAYLRRAFPTLPDIDDLIQETYVRLFRARNAGGVAEARPYLFATARNAAIDLFRRRRVMRINGRAEIAGLSVIVDQLDAAESLAQTQELAMLAAAIQALPKRCRLVLTLRKLKGHSHREIAIMLGISENTVNAQIALGITRCRDYLRTRGIGAEGPK